MVKSAELLFRSKYSNKSQDEKLLLPMYFTMRQQEKSLITKLIKSWNTWLQIPESELDKIEDILKILLSTNRVFNYLSDKPPKENDNKTAVSVYGIPMALNSSHYATCVAMEKLRDLSKNEAVVLYADENFNLHRAQEKDVNWQNKLICPSEKEYLQMAETKTGYFIRLGVQLMQLFTKNTKTDFTKLIAVLAQLFHVYDDYVNLMELDGYLINRTGFDDFKEGKFTFPIVHAIKNQPGDTQIIHLLRQRSDDDDMKQYCVKLLKQFGSLEYTKNFLVNLRNEAYEELKKFDENPEMLEVLKSLVFG